MCYTYKFPSTSDLGRKSSALEQVLQLTGRVKQDRGVGDNACAGKIIRTCLQCCLNEISLILLKHPNEFSPNKEICISLSHESGIQIQTALVLQYVLHLKSKVKHFSAL